MRQFIKILGSRTESKAAFNSVTAVEHCVFPLE